jgi:hypothetical protein
MIYWQGKPSMTARIYLAAKMLLEFGYCSRDQNSCRIEKEGGRWGG